MHSVLHIFNGDCAADAWKKAVHSSERYLVWRENYLEGPIPAADTPREEFARIRAEYLHTCAPQYSVDILTRFQCKLETILQALDNTDAVMLWFDECTCVHPEFIQKCGSNLCECTKAHEEYTWSVFFGKPVRVEIVESLLRGGKDCVIKILGLL